MAHALRLVTVRRGHDPRDFAFIAFGGAGPLHAALLARELGITRTLIPPAPGHFSAVGMLHGRLRADAVRTRVASLAAATLAPLLAELEGEAAEELGSAGGVEVHRSVQLRYAGQEHTLEVPLPDGPVDDDLIAELRAGFDDASEEAYAFSLDQPVQLVAARVAVSAPASPFEWRTEEATPVHDLPAREVDLDEHGGVRTVVAVHRAALEQGVALTGPCVIEESASTTLVLPGQTVTPDAMGNLVIEEDR
jgi:N-methylhydantoinase A